MSLKSDSVKTLTRIFLSLKRTKEYYDLIFSIGSGCSCSYHLRQNKLQHCSFPFDWVVNKSAMNIYKVFANKFADYPLKENMERIRDTPDGNIFRDNKYQIEYVHDFPKSRSFDENFEILAAKMFRRSERLIRKINSARNVLMVYQDNQIYDMNVIYQLLKEMSAIFPKQNFSLLYILFDKNYSEPLTTTAEKQLQIVKFDNTAEDWRGNVANWNKVLENIKLSCRSRLLYSFVKFIFLLKKIFLSLFINLIPIKKYRKSLRKRWLK